MKTIRKLIGMIIALAVVSSIAVVLANNHKNRQEELEAIQNFNHVVPVKTVRAQQISHSPELTESGVFRSIAEVDVISETQGQITQLDFQLGDWVKEGQVLVEVEKDIVSSQYQLALKNLEKAEKDFKRYQMLEGGEAITHQQLEEAELALQNAKTNFVLIKKQLERTSIKAPISGTISLREVEKGTYLAPGQRVCSITDQSSKTFLVRLVGANLKGMVEGMKVELKADDHVGTIFQGSVKSIGVVADQSGRYLVEVKVPDPKLKLRDGMIGEAQFKYPAQESCLVIPRKSISGSLHNAHVFVVQADSVVRRIVQVESLNDTLVKIQSGLVSGDLVVTTGQYNLQEGTIITVN